jgi:hypothetical protein
MSRWWLAGCVAVGSALGAALVSGCESVTCDDLHTCAEGDASLTEGSAGEGSVHVDAGTDASAEGEAGCPASTPDECGSTCTNKQTDPSNCGMCGKVCAGPDGGAGAATCTAGACTLGCSGSTPDNCSGGCVSLASDPDHCGMCSTVCAGPTTSGTGAAACTAGADGGAACSLSCTGSTKQACAGDCVDPTEPAHCGSSCLSCPGPSTGAGSGSAVCTVGDAGPGVCSVLCTTTDSQQCAVSGGGVACFAPTDLGNCGKCGNACAAPPSGQGLAACTGAPLNCGVTCNSGYHQCVTGAAPDGDCLSNGDVPSQTSDPCIFSVAGAVFVSASTGSSGGPGTASAPFATISEGLAHLGSTGRVYVCNGSYSEQVSITSAVSLFGGLSCTAGTWAYTGGKATVTGPANAPALSVAAGAAVVDIEDMAFVSQTATGTDGTGNGNSSIAALVSASSNVTMKRTSLTAGSGAGSSSPGTTATNYTGGTAPDGSANSGGTGGKGGPASCTIGMSAGGAGGNGVTGAAGNGGPGTASGGLVSQTGFDGAGAAAGTTGC